MESWHSSHAGRKGKGIFIFLKLLVLSIVSVLQKTRKERTIPDYSDRFKSGPNVLLISRHIAWYKFWWIQESSYKWQKGLSSHSGNLTRRKIARKEVEPSNAYACLACEKRRLLTEFTKFSPCVWNPCLVIYWQFEKNLMHAFNFAKFCADVSNLFLQSLRWWALFYPKW